MSEEVERGKSEGKATLEIDGHTILSFRRHPSKKVSILVSGGADRVSIAKKLLSRV